jgi:hypothetical protein
LALAVGFVLEFDCNSLVVAMCAATSAYLIR